MPTWTAALPVLAGATLAWPLRPAAHRIRGLRAPAGQAPTLRAKLATLHRPRPLITTAIAAVLGWLLGGTGTAVAAAMITSTARSRWQARNHTKYRLAAMSGLAEAVEAMVGELRAGAHPATAAESAATDAAEPAAAILHTVAATARLGGDVGESLRASETAHPALTGTLRPMIHAWSLAQRHGLPLAEVLAAVARDLDGQLRFARQVQARMAGPRASAAVLAALPVVGVLLGQLMGANPVHVLFTPGVGQFLLAAGTTLACVGIRWTAALTNKAVLP
ncbi:MAG TPA: type II secretion system F family protein [Pseudonocardiaceae bacterium]|jgi:tight adherence protein B|nr:type II secretion system F family protein [Pseudonocardiaceae bacterium]